MAEVTYKTESGTEITLRNIQSNSTFEIIKAAVPLIEKIELAEANGTAEELLNTILVGNVGETGGLVLTTDLARLLENQLEPDEDDDDDEDGICPVCLQEAIDQITAGFDEFETNLSQFIGVLGETEPQDVLNYIGFFSDDVRRRAEAKEETDASKATIYGIGVGLSMAVMLMTAYLENRAEAAIATALAAA